MMTTTSDIWVPPGATQRCPAPRPQLVITQSELQMYRQLLTVGRQRKELRREILERLDAGAPIEPGPLTAIKQVEEVRRLSRMSLAQLYSEAQLDAMRMAIAPSTRTTLIVR